MKRLLEMAAVILGLILLVSIAYLGVLWWLFREPHNWARTFATVQVGMGVEGVQSNFARLSPRSQYRTELRPGEHASLGAPPTAESYLFYGAVHRWKYRIFFDRDGKVVAAQKWWD